MRTHFDCLQEPTLILDGGCILFGVPWRRAEYFQELLRRRGVASILHLHPGERAARLEPRTKLGPDQILGILRGRYGAEALPETEKRKA